MTVTIKDGAPEARQMDELPSGWYRRVGEDDAVFYKDGGRQLVYFGPSSSSNPFIYTEDAARRFSGWFLPVKLESLDVVVVKRSES